MIHSTSQRPRLGDTATKVVGAGGQIVGTALATVQAASSAGLLTLSGTLAASIPVAGAVVAVGLLAFSLLHNSRGLQQNVETTAAVNRGESIMKQNLAAWNASSKSLATQAAALAAFDDAWAGITNFCANGNEGKPGERCISERQRGGQYDYFAAYRDPIQNDQLAGAVDRAAAEAENPAAILTSAAATVSALPAWLIPAGLLAAAVVLR